MRSIVLSAICALCLLSRACSQQPALPVLSPVSCVANSAVQPDQIIAACTSDIKQLKLQQSTGRKQATKCLDESVWDQSTRHPNNPDWIIDPRRSLPTAGSPYTPDCIGFYGSFDSKSFDKEIAADFGIRGDTWFALKNYSAAFSDYDDSYTIFHNEDVFKARDRAHKALKQARKALKQARKKSSAA